MTSSSLSVDNKAIERTIVAGLSVIDISKLYAPTGILTCDSGFTSTAAQKAEIDGRVTRQAM